MFSMLGPAGPDGMRVLDLFAGTGALGMEALRRGAEYCDFIEIDAKRCGAIRQELERMGFEEQGKVHRGNAESSWSQLNGNYDLIFIDPPYKSKAYAPVLEHIGSDPELTNENSIVFAEHSSKASLNERYGLLDRSTVRKYGDTGLSVFTVRPNGD
jgi:16S rRNA (guanine966-N2)-methyltransferase